MKFVLPHPLLSLSLFLASLLMSNSIAPPSLALAAFMALATPHVMRAFRLEPAKLRRIDAAFLLFGRVTVDVVRSNIAVAQILIGRKADRVSGFIHVPLDLKDRYGLAVLAIIITSTPGTLWVEYNRVTGRLLIHVFDLVDEATWVRIVKDRYEKPLRDIFE